MPIIKKVISSDNHNYIIEKEKYFIKYYGRKDKQTGILTNMTDGGDGVQGYTFTDEHKRKLAENSKGNVSRTGMKNSKEMNEKISKAQKGKPKPPSHGKNVSKATKGVKKSKQHRQALRKPKSKKGYDSICAARLKRSYRVITENVCYLTIPDAEKALGISRYHITKLYDILKPN